MVKRDTDIPDITTFTKESTSDFNSGKNLLVNKSSKVSQKPSEVTLDNKLYNNNGIKMLTVKKLKTYDNTNSKLSKFSLAFAKSEKDQLEKKKKKQKIMILNKIPTKKILQIMNV